MPKEALLFVLLVLNKNSVVFGYNNQSSIATLDCQNYDGARPHIFPLDTAYATYFYDRHDPRSKSVYVEVENNNNNLKKNQFNCTFDTPIHWVFHIDPAEVGMNVDLDFSERHENAYGISLFSSNFRLLYYITDLQIPMLFSCEPVNLTDPCQRNFLRIWNQQLENSATPTPDSDSTELERLSAKLFNSSTKGWPSPRFQSWNDCPLRFILRVGSNNSLEYKWELGVENGTKIKQGVLETNETAYFDNVFRLQGLKGEKHCVRKLALTEVCNECRSIGGPQWRPINGLIFWAKMPKWGFRLVFKGIFSVPKGRSKRVPRQFYFDWEISSQIILDEMIQLISPDEVNSTVPFNVTCRVSVFLLAYGSSIVAGERGFPTEYFYPYGYREVKQTVRLTGRDENKTVSCIAPLKKPSASNQKEVKSKMIFVHFAEEPLIDGSSENVTHLRQVDLGTTDLRVNCNASGTPQPILEFLLPNELLYELKVKLIQTIAENGSEAQLSFPPWESGLYGSYICEARNFLGVTTKTVIFTRTSSQSNIATTVGSSLGALTLVLVLAAGALVWKIRKQRHDFEVEKQRIIDEFRNGVEPNELMAEEDPHFSIHQLPYNETFEVPSSKWDIEDKILGTGQFGVVRLGHVTCSGERIKIAVKTMKPTAEMEEFKSFLIELKIMAYLGQHRNIVSLVAACSEGVYNRDVFIGVEFCDNGCLLDYLKEYREGYLNLVTEDGKLVPESGRVFSMRGCVVPSAVISTYNLYKWAYQVARGMDYLRIRKVLHGDLAARNVLLTSRKVAKVGDFGLSRVLLDSENYTKQSQTPLPWKWMAIESLRYKTFSVASDIWAYGILLYELFTVGQPPYPGIGWSVDFVARLENGMRMEKPEFCTTSIYKVMRACWAKNPSHRPEYSTIKKKLGKGLNRLSVIVKGTETQEVKHTINSTVALPNIARRTRITSQNSTSGLSDVDEDSEVYANVVQRHENVYTNCES